MLALGAGLAYLLVREPVGTVEIRTTPAVGATVSIDGVPRGRAPLRVQRIPSGERMIEVRADGYEAELRKVEVAADSVALLEIALQPLGAAPPAQVPVAPSPPDTAMETASDPAQEPAITAAEQARAAEEAARAAEEAARTAETERVAREREEAERLARERTDAERLERERLETERRTQADAQRQEREDARAAAREEQRRLAEERRQRSETTMLSGAERETTMQVTQMTGMTEVAPTRSGTATVRINSIPWSDVFLDGVNVGRTPITSLRVTPGSHRVMLRTADGRTRTRAVNIEPGETATVTERFD
jgi:hypothetical protein